MKRTVLLAAFFLAAASFSFAGEPLFLEKAYLRSDAAWSGTVVLKGQNVVQRGATLTIEPGTVVKFEWSDEDDNDIGDGELTVEGNLIARGTKEKPILFTSARENPGNKDWTFVQVSVSKNSVVERAVFEHGFTGLQIHYSRAEVRDSVFRKNFEGMRFSTADVLVEHNDFTDNSYGIRTEAHGSRTTIRKNGFRGNEYAYFPVRKTGDSVKFYENNVESSLRYNVKLGQSQTEDLNLTNNWWGSADKGEIAEKIFDKSKDETLGRVTFEPFLTGPVEGCGVR